MPRQEIPTDSLGPVDVPPANAEWSEIQEFALTFNGYSFWNGFDRALLSLMPSSRGTYGF